MAVAGRISGFAIPAILFAGAVLTLHPSAAIAQGVDMGCSPTVANPCSGGSGGGGSSGGGGFYRLFGGARETPPQEFKSPGQIANDQGIAAYNQSDWAKAVAWFTDALAKEPNDPVIRQNLANAQTALARAQAQLQIQQQNSAAADRMQQAIKNFSQSLNTAPSPTPSASGLDFTSGLATATPPNAGCATPSSTMVVDACNVPSGLPKDVENAIDGAYRNASPEIRDRVRKGFQAVMTRDWKVARAWFGDALNRDPGNAGLKRLRDLTDYTLPAGQVSGAKSFSPSQAQIAEFRKSVSDGRYTQPLDVRLAFFGLPEEEFRRVLGLQVTAKLVLPADDDVRLLYPDADYTNVLGSPSPGQVMLPPNSDMQLLFPGPDPPPRLIDVLRAKMFHIELDPQGETLIKAYLAQFK